MPKLIYRTLWLSWSFPLATLIIYSLLWDRISENSAIYLLPACSILFGLFLFAIAHFKQRTFRDKAQSVVLSKVCTSFSFLFFGINMGVLLTDLNPTNFSINEIVFLSVGVFLILFGISVREIAPNRWIGFTFPWNTNNHRVWERTHDLYYRWFVLFGGLFVILTLVYPLPELSSVLVLLAVLIPALISYRFSLKNGRNLAYRQKPKQHKPV